MTSLSDFYDPHLHKLGAGDVDSRDTVAYYRDKIGSSPQRVLDIGAGSGRVTIPLLSLGHQVIAIDSSPKMLQSLRLDAQLLADTHNLTVITQTFSARGNEATVDVAIAPDDFVLHFTTLESLRKFFRDLTTWLPTGGRFLTDIRPRNLADLAIAAHPPYLLRTFGLVSDESIGANKTYYNVVFWEEYDDVGHVLKTTCQYQSLHASGEETRSYFRVLCQRVHTNEEIKWAAKEAGFHLIEHTERNRASVPTERLIGGSFEFRL